MDGVILTPLKQISHPKGDLYHGMRKSDPGYFGFGEAYFTTINQNEIKSWRKHTKMVLNFIVPVGKIEFVIYNGKFFESIILSQENYQRMTIAPGLWVAFKGLGKENIILNIANFEHDPEEEEKLELEEIVYAW